MKLTDKDYQQAFMYGLVNGQIKDSELIFPTLCERAIRVTDTSMCMGDTLLYENGKGTVDMAESVIEDIRTTINSVRCDFKKVLPQEAVRGINETINRLTNLTCAWGSDNKPWLYAAEPYK